MNPLIMPILAVVLLFIVLTHEPPTGPDAVA